jgi:hypothetical protein
MPTFSPYHNAVVVLGRAKPDASGRFGSRASNAAGIATIGIAEGIIYLPTVDDQATLDAAAAAALAKIQASRSSSTNAINIGELMENITLEVIDKNPTGTFNPEDTVTVISPTLGLAGLYKVKRIERDMTDPNYAKLDLTTRHTEYWELDEDVRRTVRNLNTLV